MQVTFYINHQQHIHKIYFIVVYVWSRTAAAAAEIVKARGRVRENNQNGKRSKQQHTEEYSHNACTCTSVHRVEHNVHNAK